MFLTDLTTEELFSLTNCKTLDQLRAHIRDNHPKLLSVIPKPSRLIEHLPTNGKSRALLSLDQSTFAIDANWNVVSLISLGVAALPLTVGVLIFTGLWASYNYYCAYLKIAKQKQKNIEFFQLAEFQSMVLNVLSDKQSKEIKYATLSTFSLQPSEKKQDHSELKPSKLKSIFKGASVAFCLFTAYYLSIAWTFETIGLGMVLAAMATPWGLAIAIGVAALVGAFCTYQHYQAHKTKLIIREEKNHRQQENHKKLNHCYRLKTIRETLGLFAYRETKENSDYVQVELVTNVRRIVGLRK